MNLRDLVGRMAIRTDKVREVSHGKWNVRFA